MRQDGDKGLQQAVPCEDVEERRAVFEDCRLYPRQLRGQGQKVLQGCIGGLCRPSFGASRLPAGQSWRVLCDLLTLRVSDKLVFLELLSQVRCADNL